MKEKRARLAARKSLGEFAAYVTDGAIIPAAHHQIICNALQDVIEGRCNRLIIEAPPGSAKSTYATHLFGAWYIGKKPGNLIVMASHTADLAEEFSGKVRNTVNTAAYRNVFDGVYISKDAKSKQRWTTTKGSEYFAVGVGGAVTGRRADLIVIDDPFKGREAADSKATRNRVWNWYQADAFTRLKPGGAIIIIATRWHEDDLTGRLLALEAAGEGDKWRRITFQALCDMPEEDPLGREAGEALWPQWQDVEALLKIKSNISRREWNSLYQQRPAAMEGNMVQLAWFKRYDRLPADSTPKITISWDSASSDKERSDPSVATVWAKIGYQHYLLDVWSKQVEFPDLQLAFRMLANRWNPSAILVENKGTGQTLLQTFGNGMSPWNVIKCEPQLLGNKEFRFDLVTPMFEGGQILVPHDDAQPWVVDYIHELMVFPNGQHDDQVDSTSQYLAWVRPKVKRGVRKLRI